MLSVAALMILLLAPAQLTAATGNDPEGDQLTVPAEIGLMLARLEEIKEIDASTLVRAEKRELRREVRSIDKDLREYNGGGLYISVGAAILIILLLILLL